MCRGSETQLQVTENVNLEPRSMGLNHQPDSSCVESVGDAKGFVDVVGENSGCQSVRRVVGLLQDFLSILELEDGLHRTENLSD